MRYSEIFNVSPRQLEMKGVFDADQSTDSQLHIDPSLLKGCTIPEFVGAYDEFIGYFANVFSLVPTVKISARAFSGMVNRLQFREIANTCLGYSSNGTRGNGIGEKLAKKIAKSIIEIYDLGIDNPVVFEMLPFFEENIGADRISDMTSFLLVERFLKFTERICRELRIPVSPKISYRGHKFNVPSSNGQSFVFVPQKFLCDLPTASSWDDIDRVCSYNRAFRTRICEAIGANISEVMRMPKKEIKNYLFSHPDTFKEFIDDWGSRPHQAYDFSVDKKNVAKKKTVFITYCWESEEHNMWVKKLANDLSEYFNVKIDTRLPLGADLSVFMEQGIVNSDKVLMILTREYKSRADQRLNGVGYETNVITDNLYTAATPKFIPIIKEATKNDVYPIYLGNKKGLDMTNDEEYNVNLAELIKNIRL